MADFVNTVDVIGDDALTDIIIDRSITEYKDNNITNIGNYAFQSCYKLTTVNLPAATIIGNNVFNSCNQLTSVNLPAATSINSKAFQNCSSLTSVDFPAVVSIGGSAFSGCTQLTSVDFPAATYIESYAFQNCSNLTSINFPMVTGINIMAFYNCSQLNTLVLRNTAQVCTLKNTNAFTNTPIVSGTGYIYVPAALVDSYKAATNWSTYAAQFRAIEDYTVDGTTTGELDPTKI